MKPIHLEALLAQCSPSTMPLEQAFLGIAGLTTKPIKGDIAMRQLITLVHNARKAAEGVSDINPTVVFTVECRMPMVVICYTRDDGRKWDVQLKYRDGIWATHQGKLRPEKVA
jgi:hypothetical protein